MTNSLNMEMMQIPVGSFDMGHGDGDPDERPVHRVDISRPFAIGAMPVTNAQYELFDPEHRRWRGERGLSTQDDEAVVFVSWHNAVRFCAWLSRREGGAYRLPTEAEWEYACRAGTTTLFHTGDHLPESHQRHQEDGWDPEPVALRVGATPPNAFGLRDTHGLVEEWCSDWYGPYAEGAGQKDPLGRASGLFKVTRGGSHNTDVRFLRSASRSGTLPQDRHWLIGFRVVRGDLPDTDPLPAVLAPLVMSDVGQRACDWRESSQVPLFEEPIPFVREPLPDSGVPFFPHNHCPSITWCPNGDLLAVWFSTREERGREMTILGSRLRTGSREWERAAEFFKAPDRNMTGSSLFYDGAGTIYYANGLEAAGCWANLALVVRTSRDSGATWSTPAFANASHQPRNQVISGMSATREGWLIQPCDAVYGGNGGTAIHISRDGGLTWEDPGAGTPKPDFGSGETGGTIAGIHAGVVQLEDGRLLAFGRGDSRLGDDTNIGERMPRSLSDDMGRTWRYSASEFPPISGGQRLVLLRLREGPLLFVSFADASQVPEPKGLLVSDGEGGTFIGYGMFAALSDDEGESWPLKRLISGDGERRLEGGAWTGGFTMNATHAEPKGYLAATQTPDGVIHLISSRMHYRFNVAWLRQAGGSQKGDSPVPGAEHASVTVHDN
jgi:hypothetical protein